MTAAPLDSLLAEYARARSYSHRLLADLDADQVAWRPHDDSSAIGWHFGHTAAVNHYLVRNLTAAAPSLDPELDRLFDSATPEPGRGALPPVERTVIYREQVAAFTAATIGRIADGDVAAPKQLSIIAAGMMAAIINHEYQHDKWIAEVRQTLGVPLDDPEPGGHCHVVEGYLMVLIADD